MALVAVGLVAAAAGAAGGIMTVLAVLRSKSSANLVGCLAKPFTGKTEDELNKYIKRIWNNFVVLPSYDEQIHWDVYLLYKNFLSHCSVLFVTHGHIEGFLIHLVVNERMETEFHLDVVNLRSYPNKYPDLKALSLGTTEAITAKRIIRKAHDRLVNMGQYHIIYNNCQDYCNGVASDIQVSIIRGKWSEELKAIVEGGISEAADTSAVVAGTDMESVKCMQRVGRQTGSNEDKTMKELFDYYDATTNQTKKDV